MYVQIFIPPLLEPGRVRGALPQQLTTCGRGPASAENRKKKVKHYVCDKKNDFKFYIEQHKNGKPGIAMMKCNRSKDVQSMNGLHITQ